MPPIAAIMSYLFAVEHSEVYNITPSSGLEVESVFIKFSCFQNSFNCDLLEQSAFRVKNEAGVVPIQ